MVKKFLTLTFILMTVSVSAASVTNSSPSGFTIKHTFEVPKSPDAAFQAFTANVGEWWDGEHTYSGKSQNMSMELKPNGCFCEKTGSQGFIVHMTVLYSEPGKILRMSGGLGPLQQFAASGTLTMEFKPKAGGTTVEFTYAVGGYIPGGADKLAPIVDQVVVHQMTRFENFVKTGKP